jgi:ABC-2 type transport system ATP-binding protein
MIVANQLTKQFENFTAVSEISLQVAAGSVLALLGPNGAGKTTTIRMLTSILKPTSGWARVAGFDVVTQAEEVRRRVGVLTEHHGLYARMRSEEYLTFFGELYGLAPDVIRLRSRQLLEQFGLDDARDKRLGEYSKGMRQKLALIRVMLHDPDVLVLDEPTSAMDPVSVRAVRDAITALRSERRTILLCTHNLHEAEQLADQIAIIRRGAIIEIGTPSELKRRLLGPAVFELRLAAPLNGLAVGLAERLDVVGQGETWLRYRTEEPEVANPAAIAWLAEQHAPVLGLSEVERSLEDVYLQVVEATDAH